VLALILALSLALRANANVDLRKGCAVRFASVGEGAEILGRKDDFIQRLSAFDRAARMKTDRSISEDEFLKFVQGNVLTWNESEKAKIEAAIASIRPTLDALPLSLPKIVSFVKTTGAEEGSAFYTRDTAIIMPEKEIDEADAGLLKKTIAHELFHILTRGNSTLREKLYQSIGFTKCDEVEFPSELKSRKITNPDAPRNDHAIRVRIRGEEVHAVPILFSNTTKYDVNRGGEFFNYLQLSFLRVPSTSAAQPILAMPEEVSGFFEQIGRNTNYVIHPEEILADNFALLILDEHNVPSPEIIEKMRLIFGQNYVPEMSSSLMPRPENNSSSSAPAADPGAPAVKPQRLQQTFRH
jgi:hypothetical protein